ncbi:MAG: ComF family protein [Alphaproteobacteria bacterium]|nr:ComF family protein [Alphaproteobacteria bacterium]
MARIVRLLLDKVLPPRCIGCGAIVEDSGLCGACWGALQFLGRPACERCAYPFEYAAPGETLCLACVRSPPTYDRARAVFAYDDASRSLVVGFKTADKTYGAPTFAAMMGRAGEELLAEAALIVPVPLHRRRLFMRRYNQSALLAARLARRARATLAVDLLVRRRHTRLQGQLSADARRRNVQGAFEIRRKRKAMLDGKRVLLIDDVLTTGATVDECARVLRRGGATAVDVLTLARVVRPRG